MQSAFPEAGRGPSSLGRVNGASRMDAHCLAPTPAPTQAARGPRPARGGLAVSGSVETGKSGQDVGTHHSQAMWPQTPSFLRICI